MISRHKNLYLKIVAWLLGQLIILLLGYTLKIAPLKNNLVFAKQKLLALEKLRRDHQLASPEPTVNEPSALTSTAAILKLFSGYATKYQVNLLATESNLAEEQSNLSFQGNYSHLNELLDAILASPLQVMIHKLTLEKSNHPHQLLLTVVVSIAPAVAPPIKQPISYPQVNQQLFHYFEVHSEPLELIHWEIGELKLLGSIENHHRLYGIILDPQHKIHQAKLRDQIGVAQETIISISPCKIITSLATHLINDQCIYEHKNHSLSATSQ